MSPNNFYFGHIHLLSRVAKAKPVQSCAVFTKRISLPAVPYRKKNRVTPCADKLEKKFLLGASTSELRTPVSHQHHTTTATMSPTAVTKAPQEPRDVKPSKSATAHKTPEELALASSSYGRGAKVRTKSIRDKKLRGNLKTLENKYRDAASRAKDAEILRPEASGGFIEPEGELERTWKVTQKDVRKAVDVASAAKGFELELGFGPYTADYTRDGRNLLVAGRKGHVASFDWREGKLGCELQLGETVRDIKLGF
jgi:hypothetical protein